MSTFQHNPCEYEKKFYNVLSILNDSYDLLQITLKKLGGINSKPSDIKRNILNLKFDKEYECNQNYQFLENGLDKIIQLKKNGFDFDNWAFDHNVFFIEDELLIEDDFTYEEQTAENIKKEYAIYHFTDTQMNFLIFRELELKEELTNIIDSKDRKIKALQNKLQQKKVILQQSLFSEEVC